LAHTIKVIAGGLAKAGYSVAEEVPFFPGRVCRPDRGGATRVVEGYARLGALAGTVKPVHVLDDAQTHIHERPLFPRHWHLPVEVPRPDINFAVQH